MGKEEGNVRQTAGRGARRRDEWLCEVLRKVCLRAGGKRGQVEGSGRGKRGERRKGTK